MHNANSSEYRKSSIVRAILVWYLCGGAVFLAWEPAISADFGLSVEGGIGRSDNINREPELPNDPTVDEIIYDAGMTLSFQQASARAESDIRAYLFFLKYGDDLYEQETLPGLDATILFRLTDQVFRWFVRGSVGQQAIDPFEAITPGNRQNFSYLTTGPSVVVSVSRRFSAKIDAYYSDIRYGDQPLDNQRLGSQISLIRQISDYRSLSLNVRGERTDYEDDFLNPPIERIDAFVRFESEGTRNEFIVDVGWTKVERDERDAEEPLFILEWQRQVTPSSEFTLAGGTRVSDAAESFRGIQSEGSDISQVQNITSISDPFRENFSRFAMDYTRLKTGATFSFNFSDEDYERRDDFDRRVKGGRIELFRQMGRSWELGLSGSLIEREYTNIERTDKDTIYGANLIWRATRTLEFDLGIRQIERRSSEELSNFTENRVHLAMRYIPWRIQ